jgi:hypothetical protein
MSLRLSFFATIQARGAAKVLTGSLRERQSTGVALSRGITIWHSNLSYLLVSF